jgi:citrate synthase
MHEITMAIRELAEVAKEHNIIDSSHYSQHKIKRGLRNSNGTGVLVGLTKVGSVHGYEMVDGQKIPMDGKLYYRGISLNKIVDGFLKEDRHGYEETAFLLLFGKLPTKKELETFRKVLDYYRYLPEGYTENMILKIPSSDIMNKLQRSTLVLYSHDDNPDDLSIQNMIRQSIELIAKFPTIVAYSYQAKSHYFDKKSLVIHSPLKGASTAENILHMLRADNKYSKTEVDTLDLALVLHAEHGGGNNSTFATHVVSSSGTDTYSAIATAVGALKGPKHGGANIKVKTMIENIKENVENYSNKAELKKYLKKILDRETFNREGLIYGMGHAVYTISDPRAVLLKEKAKELAIEKNAIKEYTLYTDIEELTKEIFKEEREKEISANVDLYSGFVYEMLNIPMDIYTPLFAIARVTGWCAHRIEQVVSDPKILRPGYKTVFTEDLYQDLTNR